MKSRKFFYVFSENVSVRSRPDPPDKCIKALSCTENWECSIYGKCDPEHGCKCIKNICMKGSSCTIDKECGKYEWGRSGWCHSENGCVCKRKECKYLDFLISILL